MDMDDFIVAAFCIIDDTFRQLLGTVRLRQRGPAPALADSEVLTMEMVGEYLSLNQDKAIFDYFRRHYSHFSPAIGNIHRTTFVRQAANLCRVKEMVWQHLLEQIGFDPSLNLIDSFPLPVCQFARAYRCRRFRGECHFGYDTLARQTFYGFRVHALVAWPGLIVSFGIVPANVHENAEVHDLGSDDEVPSWATATTGAHSSGRNWFTRAWTYRPRSNGRDVTPGHTGAGCSAVFAIE